MSKTFFKASENRIFDEFSTRMKGQRHIFIRLGGIIFLIASLLSCKPETISPAELIQITEPQGEFLLYSPADSRYSFEVIKNQREGNDIEYVRVMLSVGNGESYEFSKLTQFPSKVRLSLQDAVESITPLTLEDLSRGSAITTKFLVKREKAGEEILPGELELKVVCPAPVLAGTYEAESSGVSGPGGGGKFHGIRAIVEIKEIGPHEFDILDATGGVFTEIWAAKPESARLIENCRQLEFPSFTDQFDDTFTGEAILSGEGDIELRWKSSYGDTGITVFRKK